MKDRVEETVLDNGLTVLTVENRISPTASVQIWYRVGSKNERPGITGASHIFEHMMFKGTERFPKGTFDRVIQDNGMTNNAFTSHDFTAYFENMASDRLEVAFALESDRMQGLLLEPKEFESEMAVIREERRQTCEDPPFGLLSEAVEAAVFMVHPYHWPVIGWMTDLETVTLEELRGYYVDFYRPNNAVLVVVGDIEHRQVCALAEDHFGSIAPGPTLCDKPIVEPEQKGERTVSVHKDVQLPGLLLAYRTVGSVDPEAPALNVAEYLLFRGRSSRLYQRLIYEQSLATTLSGGFYLRTDPSTFSVRAVAQPDIDIEELRGAILETIESLVASPPTASELEKVRNQMEADFVFGQEHNFEIAQAIGTGACRSSWRELFEFHERCMTVDAHQVARVVSTWFGEKNRTVGYLVPEKESL